MGTVIAAPSGPESASLELTQKVNAGAVSPELWGTEIGSRRLFLVSRAEMATSGFRGRWGATEEDMMSKLGCP